VEVVGVPKVLYEGQGGLLDVVLHPKFSENKLIYLSYSKFKDSISARWSTTAILQARLEGNELKGAKDIFIAQPYAKTKHHYGGRMAFDKAEMLFFSIGDRGNHFRNPQRLDNDCGKIHRIFDDGRIPKDNPFAAMDTARPTIWSYGHRNPQGLVIADNGTIWEHEHGPRGGDELNIIRKAANYGWPTISYGINYDGSVLTPLTSKAGMEQPENYWIPSIAPCGMAICASERYPAWKGDILIGSLSFEYLNRCKLVENKVKEQEVLLPQLGRVRCVAMDNDGFLYVAVEKKGFIFRLLPL
jgi:glucose/arabinose dehydrogenase